MSVYQGHRVQKMRDRRTPHRRTVLGEMRQIQTGLQKERQEKQYFIPYHKADKTDVAAWCKGRGDKNDRPS